MDKKTIFKITFSEQYINEMLNKGWKLIEFKRDYGAVFKECPSDKYICKKVLVDLCFEEDSKQVENKLKEVSKLDQAEVIPLQYENCMLLMYYIIYEKERVISDETLERNISASHDKNYITKGISKLLFKIFLPIFYTSCYIFIWTVWSMESDSYLYKITLYMCIIIAGYSGICSVVSRTRGLILTLYNRYICVKNN